MVYCFVLIPYELNLKEFVFIYCTLKKQHYITDITRIWNLLTTVTFGVYRFGALILMVFRLCVLFMMCHFEVVMTTRE